MSDGSDLLLVLGVLLGVGLAAGSLVAQAKLPTVCGYLLSGTLVAGAFGPSTMTALAEELATAKRLALCIVMFEVGTRLRTRGLGTSTRSALPRGTCMPWFVAFGLGLGAFCTLRKAPPILAFAGVDGLTWTTVMVLSASLPATSPTLLTVMRAEATPCLPGHDLGAGVVWNAACALVLVTLAAGSGTLSFESALRLLWETVAGVSAGALFGAALSLRSKQLAVVQVWALACGYLALQRIVRTPDVALPLAGVASGFAQGLFGEQPPKDRSPSGASFLAGITLFAVEGARIDWPAIVALWPWATLFVVVRALVLWLGLRVPRLWNRESAHTSHEPALLLLAGFPLLLFDVLFGASAPGRVLLLASVTVSLLLTPVLVNLGRRFGKP